MTSAVEYRKNGHLSVLITPKDRIEIAYLEEIAARSANGQPVKVTYADGVATFSVEA